MRYWRFILFFVTTIRPKKNSCGVVEAEKNKGKQT